MSDEETDLEDSETFIKCIPKWRSNKLNKLIEKLDERYVRLREKDNCKPCKSQENRTTMRAAKTSICSQMGHNH